MLKLVFFTFVIDFAVGAPYEGKGAVYIYHGSGAKEGFNTKYVQVWLVFIGIDFLY